MEQNYSKTVFGFVLIRRVKIMSLKLYLNPYINFITDRTIRVFNDVLVKIILEQVKDKKSIGIHLSGGKDTRAILAILKGASVRVDGALCIDNEKKNVKEDLKISSLICEDLGLDMIKVSECNDFFSLSKMGNYGFDIILSGFLMTEILDRGFSMKCFQIMDIVYKTQKLLNEVDKLCVPMIDSRCLVASNFIPFYFKNRGNVNRKVITCNYPKLLKYPIHS
jgi:hypothetical protein